MQSMFYQATETISLSGRKIYMLLIDELFLFLCRLRARLLEQDLAVGLNCSSPDIRTFESPSEVRIQFLYLVLRINKSQKMYNVM